MHFVKKKVVGKTYLSIAETDTPYYFVGSLKPYDYKHFMEIPLEKFQLVPMGNGEEEKKKDDIYAYRTREEALGAGRTVVVTYEQKLYNRNLKTFIKSIDKRNKEQNAMFDLLDLMRYKKLVSTTLH